jgi:hypothetical protein
MKENLWAANSTKSNLIIYGSAGFILLMNPLLNLDSKLVEISSPGPIGEMLLFETKIKKRKLLFREFYGVNQKTLRGVSKRVCSTKGFVEFS